MKQFVRSFALGLFVASLVIFIFYNYFDEPEVNPNDFTTDELINLVEDDGYRVITEEDYISYTVNEDQNGSSENTEDDNDKDKDDNEENLDNQNDDSQDEDQDEENENNETVEYTLEIKEGMMPHEVIVLLEDKAIIEDANKFSKFMEDNDYSPYIQQGKFDLTSEMSQEEIAKKITKK